MNCFTGPVLRTIMLSDQPKTSDMNTKQLHFPNENQKIKDSFKQLFLIQIQLEDYENQPFC